MSKKILIVDDEFLVRKALGRLMISEGHQVIEASNGQEGLALWQENPPDFAFIDIMMPLMTGPEMLKVLSPEQKKHTQIYVMSAFNTEDDLPFKKDIQGFIQKPFSNLFALKELIK